MALTRQRLWFADQWGDALGELTTNPLFLAVGAGGPESFWRAADYGSGSLVPDGSGNGRPLTIVGDATFNAAGRFFNLGQTTGKLNRPGDDNEFDVFTDQFTVVLTWRSLAPDQQFTVGPMSKVAAAAGWGFLWLAAPTAPLSAFLRNAALTTDAATSPTPTLQNIDYVHAFRRTATTVDLYENGIVGSGPNNNINAGGGARIEVGTSAFGGATHPMRFYGAAFFRRALSNAEIAQVGTYLRGL